MRLTLNTAEMGDKQAQEIEWAVVQMVVRDMHRLARSAAEEARNLAESDPEEAKRERALEAEARDVARRLDRLAREWLAVPGEPRWREWQP